MEPIEKFKLQDAHPITEKGREFLASLDDRNKALHTMMSKSLGSSYFVERTHAFRKWVAETSKAHEKKS
jgi:hypothetical protein